MFSNVFGVRWVGEGSPGPLDRLTWAQGQDVWRGDVR
jgi:hypothetical protein